MINKYNNGFILISILFFILVLYRFESEYLFFATYALLAFSGILYDYYYFNNKISIIHIWFPNKYTFQRDARENIIQIILGISLFFGFNKISGDMFISNVVVVFVVLINIVIFIYMILRFVRRITL